MKKLLSLALMGAFALGAATFSSCGKGDGGGDDPVISITTQPTSPAAFTEGNISGSLIVAAKVEPNVALTYQWYSNTSASNTGGTAIGGQTSASFTIPTNLTAAGGPYYY
jgi:hypothetical protein